MPAKIITIKDMTILPNLTGCLLCGKDHAPDQPHNKDNLTYQYMFYKEHGRWPKWEDAMAHCPDDIKEFWRNELIRLGAWDA